MENTQVAEGSDPLLSSHPHVQAASLSHPIEIKPLMVNDANLKHEGDSTSKNRENNYKRPAACMSPKEIKKEKFSIWKNVTVISVSFMCLFTAYGSVANLQSSINSDAGLGTWSQATVYGALIISSMFIPTWLISKLKYKWTLVLCQLCYSGYIFAQFFPNFGSLIATGFLVGIAAAPLWSAKSTYLTKIAHRYSELLGEKSPEPVITRFFGIFFMIHGSSLIWGSLITSLVLSMNEFNSTRPSGEQLNYCGADFCSGMNIIPANVSGYDSEFIIEKPSIELIELLSGILLGFSLLATAIIAVFIDGNVGSEETFENGTVEKSGWEMLTATFSHMKNLYQILLIPITLFCGFQSAFLTADFTEAYITCSWGVENLGYVFFCYGTTSTIASLAFSTIAKLVGRVFVFLFGAVLNFALFITLLFLKTDSPEVIIVYFIVAALWGLADSVWNIQLNSFYGFIFPGDEEAAFSNARLWRSLGTCLAFGCSSFLCTDAKLYFLILFLAFSMCAYLVIEINEFRKSKLKRVSNVVVEERI